MNKKINFENLNLNDIYKTYAGTMPKKSKEYFLRFLNIKNVGQLSDVAYLIGKVMGDGHLDLTYSLKFISGNRETLTRLNNLLIDKFAIPQEKLKINQKLDSKGESFVLGVNFTPLGRVLSLMGAPTGNKTKKPFLIPSWINQSLDYKKSFLQAILEDELTTIKIVKKTHANAPMLKLTKEKRLVDNLNLFLLEIKSFLNDFGVGVSNVSKPMLTKTDKYEMYFEIFRNKDNIIKFAEQIGFRLNDEKIRKLEDCVKVLKTSLTTELQKKDI